MHANLFPALGYFAYYHPMADPEQVWAVVVEYHGDSAVIVARRFMDTILRKLDKVFGSSSSEGVRVLLQAKGEPKPGEFDDHTEEGWSTRVSRPKWHEKLLGASFQRRIEHEIANCTRWCEQRHVWVEPDSSPAQ
ncbi:hypothetical protein ACFLQU_00445 [Verrucomicrobiota bacterium]